MPTFNRRAKINRELKTRKLRSSFEDRVTRDLASRGIPYEYEGRYIVYIGKPHRYIPDITLENGVIVEVKGYFDAKDRAKHLLIKAQHPDLDIRFVFQNAKLRLSKSSKTTYSQWAERHGFLWAEGYIPTEWAKETK